MTNSLRSRLGLERPGPAMKVMYFLPSVNYFQHRLLRDSATPAETDFGTRVQRGHEPAVRGSVDGPQIPGGTGMSFLRTSHLTYENLKLAALIHGRPLVTMRQERPTSADRNRQLKDAKRRMVV